MNSPIYTKKLCMTELSIRRCRIPHSKFFDAQDNAKLTAVFLLKTDLSIEQICEAVGFPSTPYFTEHSNGIPDLH